MARLVQTKYIPNFGFKIVNHLTEGGKDVNTFFKGDTVTDLKYVKDHEVITVSGKIVDILIYFSKATDKTSGERKSFLTSDAKVVSITIDHSTENNSAVDVIDAKEILDYNATGEVKRVSVLPTVTVDFESTLSDGTKTTTTFEEGKKYYDMTILGPKGEDITNTFEVPAFAYTADSKGNGDIYGVVLDDGSNAKAMNFLVIKNIGTEPTIIDDPEQANEILHNIPEGKSIIEMTTNVEIDSPIDIPEGAEVVLNMNGHTMTVPEPINNRSVYAINNYGTMTIDDYTVSARGIQNFGTMVINNCDITARDTNGGAGVWNEGDLTVNGGVFKTTYVGSTAESHGPGCLHNSGTCTINAGEFLSVNKRCYAICSDGDITIPNGDNVQVHGAHGGIAIDAGYAVINGGVYTSTEFYGLYVSNDGIGTPEKAQVTVNGGEFTGKVTSVYIGSDSGRPVDSIIYIYDGIFNNKLQVQQNVIDGAGIKIFGGSYKEPVQDEILAPGYACEAEPNEDGYYTIYEKPINEVSGD